ncbi:NIPSNAP family protein [Nonomuraea rhodomycinica]|uniref:NIPSNAP family protein n=1 Tax=Nonomuraea rhodomycinica TaxID=1712872 RepID=A0A7Y6IM73_9ACTN|nr:NIPSNAP family protein [Nonomuraea rhodomycinica]NUW40536.1 NIPSNAP family protein [Nonomuraea rhodomycinica]
MIYELRRYTLHPGRRDTLIELFEREFVESQEAVGIGVAGQFRDLDAPDIFFWMRKFPDMEARRVALAAFYGGPVWKAHREAANATMIDSDDVLLLRPAALSVGHGEPPTRSQDALGGPDTANDPSQARHLGAADDPIPAEHHGATGDPFPATTRPPVGAVALPGSVYLATVHHVVGDVAGFPAFFAERVVPVLAEGGGSPVACFESEHSPNTYPALPVRTGEDVFVWFARFEREEDLGKARGVLEEEVSLLEGRVAGPPQRFRLAPTARSALR